MLSAQDRDQVLQWSQRQLGTKARLISVSEKDYSEAGGLVEKDGTGITVRESDGCQPVLSIMANFMQNVSEFDRDHVQSDACVNGPRTAVKMTALH